MYTPTRREVLGLLLTAPAIRYAYGDDTRDWITLFNGGSLRGWQAGPRPGVFYASLGHNAAFKNFELSAEAMTRPGTNGGICFHTDPKKYGTGLEVRINNSDHTDNRKTGSLIGLRHVYKQFVKDNEWFNLNIQVRGTQVQVRLNNMLVVDYVQPEPPFQADPDFDHTLHRGTFAIKTNAPGETQLRNIRVRPLPDNLTSKEEPPDVDEIYREAMRLGVENYPVVDYHVHLKGGLTLDQALANSRRLGIGYGIAINCGLNFPVHDDASVHDYLETMKGQPCYVALQGEGREWMTLTSPESVARFDYCFTDAMTFRDPTGFRRRLYVPEEMGDLSDPQAFMEMYVSRIEGVMREPIDIYANATFLPAPLRPQYDALWTAERMKRVIDAAIENDVAIEINNRYKIPSAAFIKAAKAAGAKFSFGTNNPEAELGRLEFPIEMVRACGLKWQDIFVPKPDGEKPIQARKWQMTRE
jgi:3-keto-disaccharide hydrolase